ncbi:MAG: aspartate-semialdehyde dehydrogenase [Planctomycetota bacterium]
MSFLQGRSEPVVAIVGATGAVGCEFLQLFEQRSFPHSELRLLSSPRSAGTTMRYRGDDITVRELSREALAGVDIALFSAGGSVSTQWGPIAVEAGAVVIDNSSAFRMTDGVPLVIPEINGALVDAMQEPGIIANPNCSTIIMLVPLEPLRARWGIERVIVSTYQAASGAGAAAMAELESQTRDVLEGRPATPKIFDHPCAFNVFSHNTTIDPETGRNVEEQKMINETHKIWDGEDTRVAPTCVRVPVLRTHTESMHVTLRAPASEAELRSALAEAPGVEIVDDRSANRFPMPIDASGRDPVLVGRIRPAADAEPGTAFEMLVCGDQLRKGAALNAVQIAERLLGVHGV